MQKKNSKLARTVLKLFDRFNLTCQKTKENKINRTDSYTNTIDILQNNSTETESNQKKINRNDSYTDTIYRSQNNQPESELSDEKECDTLATKIEYVFTSLFFIGFIIYTAVIFSERPNYS